MIRTAIDLCLTTTALYYVAGLISLETDDPSFILAPIVLLIFVGLRVAFHFGYENTASVAILCISWLTTSYVFIFQQNGLRAPPFTAWLAFQLIYAGLVHGKLGANIFLGTTFALTIALMILESNGVYFSEPAIPSIFWAAFALFVVFTAITLMLYRVNESFEQSGKRLAQASMAKQDLESQVHQLKAELVDSHETTLAGLSRTIEMRNKELHAHSQRVTALTLRLAAEFGVEGDELLQVRYGALLHDIGQIGIPSAILLKPEPLSAEDRKIMEQHPLIAHELLKGISFLRKASDIVYYHHERWDGTGFPLGKKGEEIPFSARLISVVDVWDALTSNRPYSKPWSQTEAKEFIREQSGRQFDPLVVNKFLRLLN